MGTASEDKIYCYSFGHSDTVVIEEKMVHRENSFHHRTSSASEY